MIGPLHELLFLAALAGAVEADVVVVDPGGGSGGAALLQAAIDAAAPGDILLLRSGDYTDADISLSGKPLSLVNDTGGLFITLRRLSVALPSGVGGTILLRGLEARPTPGPSPTSGVGLAVSGPLAAVTPSVWIEDCLVTGAQVDADGPGGLPTFAEPAILLAFVPRTVLARCGAKGGDGFDELPPGQPATAGAAGLEVFAGTAVVHEGLFVGGHGGDGDNDGVTGSDGGPGIEVLPAVATIMGATLQGGDEGVGNPAATKPGAGLLVSSSATAWVRDTDAMAGDVQGAGTPVPPIVVQPTGQLVLQTAPARTLAAPAPLREGEAAALAVQGVAGDGVFLWVAADAWASLLPAKQGAFVLLAPLPAPQFLGVITDPGGALDVPFSLPPLPAGLDGEVLFLQAAVAPSGGGLVLGTGTTLVWIDAAL